ncbi:MAG TPA: DUF4185 domain-containing protein [Spirochaetota bacterium]|nr:DUF4185 domain-containing protein [Spirochaetota bacterium]
MKRYILLTFLFFLFCTSSTVVKEHGIFAPSRHAYTIGQDGVCSIDFDENTTLWTFGDTIIGKWKNKSGPEKSLKEDAIAEGMISNSIAWSDKINSSNFKDIKLEFLTKNGKITQFIKNKTEENPLYHRFWALDGVRIKNKVYVYFLHVFIPDHSKFLEFKILSVGIAFWEIPNGWKKGDEISFERIDNLFTDNPPAFGASAIRHNGYVYLAGHFKKGISFPAAFARVKEDLITDRSSYEFLDSNGNWVANLQDAGEFFGDVSGECSISYNSYLQSFIILYSQIFTGQIMMARFKDFGEIPFAKSISVYKPLWNKEAQIWPYSGKEIFSYDKKVFVIYIDPLLYQPILVEIELKD